MVSYDCIVLVSIRRSRVLILIVVDDGLLLVAVMANVTIDGS